MEHQTKLERRLDRALGHVSTPRGAAIVIATASVAIAVGSAVLMTIVDRKEYPSIGSGLWWAVQTVTTVGYGDNVPTTVPGRLVAAAVMLFGIGFLSVVTAAITSSFVTRTRQQRAAASADTPTAEQLRQIDERLARIEAALTRSS